MSSPIRQLELETQTVDARYFTANSFFNKSINKSIFTCKLPFVLTLQNRQKEI